jgi:hypothetical protein
MHTSEIIVEIGAEGGSLTLYGKRETSGWLFSRRVIDQSAVMLGDDAIDLTSSVVNTWPQALDLLGQYRWEGLYPLFVHPEFRQAVYEAVRARLDLAGERTLQALERWSQVCDGSVSDAGRGEQP